MSEKFGNNYLPTAYDNFVVYQRLGPGQEGIITLDGKLCPMNSDYYFKGYYDWLLKDSMIDTCSDPIMFYNGYGRLHQLETYKLDKNTVDLLNQKGLNIYLNEILIFTKDRNKLIPPPKFDEPMPVYMERAYHDSEQFFDSSSVAEIFCYEFESLELFAKNNGLTNVNVYTCHYNIRKFFQDKYPSIKLFCRNSFLSAVADCEDLVSYKFSKDEDLSKHIEKKFFCANWRYAPQRHIVAAYLSEKSTILSWFYKNTPDVFLKNIWFNLDSWSPEMTSNLINGAAHLSNSAPKSLDQRVEGIVTLDGNKDHLKYPNGFTSSHIEDHLGSFYKKAFCMMISETRYSITSPTLSEKVLMPLKGHRPFITVSAPGTLEYLQKLGFKTFDRWWDESYDKEEDHGKRIKLILEVIDYIDSFSVDQLQLMYKDMWSVLDHNYKIARQLKYDQPILY